MGHNQFCLLFSCNFHAALKNNTVAIVQVDVFERMDAKRPQESKQGGMEA